jgi:hypothetical protein
MHDSDHLAAYVTLALAAIPAHAGRQPPRQHQVELRITLLGPVGRRRGLICHW